MVAKKTREMVIERDGKCKECGSTVNLTIDHIVPLSKGGTNAAVNLQTLCYKCNGRKGNHIRWGWVERIIMALHVEELVTNVKNELRGHIASIAGQLRNDIKSANGDTLAVATKLIDNQQKQIGYLTNRLADLEKFLKVEHVVETKEFRGYKKITRKEV